MKCTHGLQAMAGTVTAAAEPMEVDPPATQLACVENYYATAPINAVTMVLSRSRCLSPCAAFRLELAGSPSINF